MWIVKVALTRLYTFVALGLLTLIAGAFGGLCGVAHAQDNYEIQVYGADTVAPKTTMLELHSNLTADGTKPLPGSKYAADGLYPANHAEHETVEILQGISSSV